MDTIIALEGVTKRFSASAPPAVDDVSIEIPRGRCFAWLGPNGCGKTTLIRLMLGLARPTSGSIHVRGLAVPQRAQEALARVGAIVEEPSFQGTLSGRRNLEVWAALHGPEARARIAPALERVGLTDRSGERVKGYSLGMKQRLGVARALLSDPELLVLDEPTNGLDPSSVVAFRTMIRELVAEGRSVFISSHLLDEVERMADDVAIVQRGRVVASGTIDELREGAGPVVAIRVAEPSGLEARLRELPMVGDVTDHGGGALDVRVTEAGDAALRAVGEGVFAAGAGLLELRPRSTSLEQRFLEITGGAPAGAGRPAAGAPPTAVPSGPGWAQVPGGRGAPGTDRPEAGR